MVGRLADKQACPRGTLLWKAVLGGWVEGEWSGETAQLLQQLSGGAADVSLEATEGIAVHRVCFPTSPGGKGRPLIWLRAKQLAFVSGDENRRSLRGGKRE